MNFKLNDRMSPVADIMNCSHLHCPICSEPLIHFGEPFYIKGRDSYRADGYWDWRGRGTLIVIPLSCEMCDGWDDRNMALCLGFHKGTTSIWIKRPSVEEKTDNPEKFPLSKPFSER